jgi:hypothetical protein
MEQNSASASRKWPSSSLEPIYKLRRCTRSQGHTARVRLIHVLEVVFFVDCHSTIDMSIGSKKDLSLIILETGECGNSCTVTSSNTISYGSSGLTTPSPSPSPSPFATPTPTTPTPTPPPSPTSLTLSIIPLVLNNGTLTGFEISCRSRNESTGCFRCRRRARR